MTAFPQAQQVLTLPNLAVCSSIEFLSTSTSPNHFNKSMKLHRIISLSCKYKPTHLWTLIRLYRYMQITILTIIQLSGKFHDPGSRPYLTKWLQLDREVYLMLPAGQASLKSRRISFA